MYCQAKFHNSQRIHPLYKADTYWQLSKDEHGCIGVPVRMEKIERRQKFSRFRPRKRQIATSFTCKIALYYLVAFWCCCSTLEISILFMS